MTNLRIVVKNLLREQGLIHVRGDLFVNEAYLPEVVHLAIYADSKVTGHSFVELQYGVCSPALMELAGFLRLIQSREYFPHLVWRMNDLISAPTLCLTRPLKNHLQISGHS